jgi:TatD DNase family protein
VKLIDIGINLMHQSFDRDREAVIARAEAAGVSPLVITGTNIAASREAADYAGAFAAKSGRAHKLYATAGVHPHAAKTCGDETTAILRELAGRETVIAVGECGLDYNRDFSPRPVQRLWFEKQIELAAELGMPLFLHERDAFPDFSAMLKRYAGIAFVVHCFTGRRQELETYLSLGAYIGITGWICDERRGTHLWDLVKEIPADRLMVETDAPYLLPKDLPGAERGQSGGRSGRNEPRHLPHITGVIAAKLEKDAEQLAAETFANTRRFFGRLLP